MRTSCFRQAVHIRVMVSEVKLTHEKASDGCVDRRWVNPGFTWNKQQYVAAGFDRYSVSQRIILVLLVPGSGVGVGG